MIANSGKDENGKYSGGKAGDQTGKEWEKIPFYKRPWLVALEPPNETIGNDMALLAAHGADNNNIGYDQSQRLTFYNQLMKAKNYDPANIKVKCESDCSAGVAALAIAVGKRNGNKKMAALSPSLTTRGLREALKNAGWIPHTESKYLNSDEYLGKGWALLNDQHHTAINLTKGSKYKSSTTATTTTKPSTTTTTKPTTSTTTTKKYSAGKYKVTAKSGLNVRAAAGITNKIIKALSYNTSVNVTETKKVGNDWWGKISSGWICMERNTVAYVKKA